MHRSVLLVPVAALALLAPLGAAAQDAPPAPGPIFPDPAECTVEPRPRAFFEQFVGTPTAAQEQAMAGEATPAAAFRMPEGDPADEATRAAVLDTIWQLGACINAGDFVGRYAALFTEDELREQFAVGPIPAEALAMLEAAPVALPPEQRVGLLAVVDVRELPDGRVAALVEVQDPFAGTAEPSRFYWEFAQEDGRWLIDEEVMLGPIPDERVGTPTA